MLRPLRILILSLSLIYPTIGHTQTDGFYAEIHTFNHGGPLPLRQLINDLKGSVFPGTDEHALSHLDWEVGTQLRSGWGVGIFFRHDYYTHFSPDTVRLMHQDKNDLPVETNQHYDLWLSIHHVRADGVRLHMPQAKGDSLQFGLSVSLFHATGLIDGEISGEINTTTNSFGGLVELDYRYDRDRLLDRKADSPKGWGLGIDLEVQWQATQQLDVHLQLKDIAAQIRWEQAPYTTAQLTSSTVNFDENGFIETTPALSGFEGYKTYTQKLPLQSTLQISYRMSDLYGLHLVDEVYSTEHFPSIGASHWSGGDRYNLAWQLRSQALQIGWQNEALRLKITLDHFNLKKTKTFGVELSMRFGG